MNQLEPQFEVLLAAGVTGCFPEYLEVANNLSLDALAVPESLWRFLTNNSAHWTVVSSFWRQVGKSKLHEVAHGTLSPRAGQHNPCLESWIDFHR